MKNPNDSTQLTFSQVYTDFKEAVSGVAEALKVGAEHVYEILVRQQVINSITLILVSVLLFLIGAVLIKYGLKNCTREVLEYGETQTKIKESKIVLLVASGVVLSVVVIFTTVQMSTIMTGLLNPEYGAIMEIRSFIR